MSNVAIPQNVKQAIADYDAIKQERSDAVTTNEEKAEQLSADLAQEQNKLRQHMDDTIENSTAANHKKEQESRKRVAELEMQITGARERAKRARQMHHTGERQAAVKAMETAKQHVDDKFSREVDERMQAIADAKTAYLRELMRYAALREYCNDVVSHAAHETNPNYRDEIGRTKASTHAVYWNDFDSPQADGSRYTVKDYEMNAAIDHGVVKQDGRKL